MKLYTGVVEDRLDDLELGRLRVRVHGLHTENKQELATTDLPWAYVLNPIQSASISGIGFAPVGCVTGTTVVLTFLDDYEQVPLVLGTIVGIPMTQSAQKLSELSGGVVFKDGDGLLDSTINLAGDTLDTLMDNYAADALGLNDNANQQNETHLNVYKMVPLEQTIGGTTNTEMVYQIRLVSDADNSGLIYGIGYFDTGKKKFLFRLYNSYNWEQSEQDRFTETNTANDGFKYKSFRMTDENVLNSPQPTQDIALNYFDEYLQPTLMKQG